MKQPHERLAEARRARGFADASDAARALGVPPPTYLGHENGSRGLARSARRYAEFYRVSLDWLLTGRGDMKRGSINPDRIKIRVNGFVGAGAKVELVQDARQANLPDWIDMRHPSGLKALIVRGNSQRPRFRDGEVILYDPDSVDPASLIGQYAVVQCLRDGDRQVKILRRGRGENRWRLDSHNDEPQEDVELFGAWRILGVWFGEDPTG